MKGYLLCRGPCVETTIPVFGGMSGGSACLYPKPGGKLLSFGVVSSDSDDYTDKKNDRTQTGSSIISLISPESVEAGDGSQLLKLSLTGESATGTDYAEISEAFRQGKPFRYGKRSLQG